MTTKDIPTPAERDWWQRGYDAAKAEDRRKLAAFDALLAACEAARHYLLILIKNYSQDEATFAQLEAATALARKEAHAL